MNHRRNARLLTLAGLALLLFSPPLILLFDQPAANGLSWLPLYLFLAWGVVIIGAALSLRGPDAKTSRKPREERRSHEE